MELRTSGIHEKIRHIHEQWTCESRLTSARCNARERLEPMERTESVVGGGNIFRRGEGGQFVFVRGYTSTKEVKHKFI